MICKESSNHSDTVVTQALVTKSFGGFREEDLITAIRSLKQTLLNDIYNQKALYELSDYINSVISCKPIKKSFSKELNILIVIASPTRELRTAIRDHILAFERFTDHNIFYLNIAYKKSLPPDLRTTKFDLIIFHTKFFSGRWDRQTFNKFLESDIVLQLKRLKAVKVIIPQDEFLSTDILCDFINDFDIKHVFTCTLKEEWKYIYNNVDFNKTKFHPVLTGYVDDITLKTIASLEQKNLLRNIDIGYRAWRAEDWLGRHGLLKWKIADVFNNEALKYNLKIDISTKEEDTFHGNSWYEFLLRCKYFIGVEGGSSLLDRDGTIKDSTRAYKKLHPYSTFEETEQACFPGKDGNLKLYAISPRHLEACATRTCQILVEGNYNGILKPGLHYISLKKDFSNLKEVMELIGNEKLRREITYRAYNDIILSEKYSYKKFVEEVINESLNVPELSELINFEGSELKLLSDNKTESHSFGFGDFKQLEIILQNNSSLFPKNVYEELSDLFKSIKEEIAKKIVEHSRTQLNKNDVFGALSSVKVTLRLVPQNLAANYVYNKVLLKMDDIQTALGNLNGLIMVNPDNIKFLLLAANIAIKSKNYNLAESYLIKAIKKDSNNINILNQFGRLKFIQQDKNDAFKMLNDSLKLKKENPEALLLLGKIFYRDSEYQKALDYLKLSLEYDNRNIEAWLEVLSIAKEINSDQLIRTSLRIIEELDPENIELKKYTRANCKLEKYEILNKTESINEKFWFDVMILQFDMLLERGIRFLKKNKPEIAISSLIRAFEIEPEHPGVLFQIGLYFIVKKLPERAIIYFNKILENYPFYPQINLCTGLAYDFSNKAEQAEFYYLKEAEGPHNNLLISKLMFLFFARRDNFSTAKNILLKAYKNYPYDLQLLIFIAKFAEYENDKSFAKKIFSEILKLYPDNIHTKRGLRRIELSTKNLTGVSIQPDTVTMLVDDKRIDRRVLDEAETLSNNGWKVTVIAGHPTDEMGINDEEAYPSLNIIRVRDIGFFSLELLDGLINYEIKLCKNKNNFDKIGRILLEVLPDTQDHIYFEDSYYQDFFLEALENPAKIYVGHDLTQLTNACIVAKYYNSFLVYDSHELYPEQFENSSIKKKLTGIEKTLIKYVDRTITVNQSIALEFQKNYGIVPNVILNCPSGKNYSFSVIKNKYFNEKYKLSDETKILLYQGNLTARERNLENLIEAMNFVSNDKVVLVLMGPDYGDKKILSNLASKHQLLNSKIFFHDAVAQNEILGYTASADAGIIPYPATNLNHYYCTPNKLFEFIAAGIPIIANDLPELNKFISMQGIGVNFKMKTANDIASAIDNFFNSDVSTYLQNLKIISKKYTWNSQENKIIKIFSDILSAENKEKDFDHIKKIV